MGSDCTAPARVGYGSFTVGSAGLEQPESLNRGTRGRENRVLPVSGRRKNPCVRRAVFEHWNSTNLPRASRVTDSSGSLSGAGATNEGKQKAFVPPPAGRAGRVPREVFRGKCRIPLAGFASRGRVASPRRETLRPPLGASGALPPRFARLRGRGLSRFCRLHHVGPLRPGIGTFCTKHRIPQFFTSAFPGLLNRHKDYFVF